MINVISQKTISGNTADKERTILISPPSVEYIALKPRYTTEASDVNLTYITGWLVLYVGVCTDGPDRQNINGATVEFPSYMQTKS